jgi:hypothetical protein
MIDKTLCCCESGRIRIPKVSIADLHILLWHLDADELSPLWFSGANQFIGLLVERDPTAKAVSDASYAGIGGWTPSPFLLMWRITCEDMEFLGFPMKQIQASIDEPATADAEGPHINPLKFVAALVSL